MMAPSHVLELRVPLVLASASPRRAQILKNAGVVFDVVPANIDESNADTKREPAEYARMLATLKASAVFERRPPGGVVLGADTLVVRDDTILGKPADQDEAKDMLRSLRGRAHQVCTGVAIAGDLGEMSASEVTEVRFRDYTDEEIESYVKSGLPMDKAGAYGVQDSPFSPALRVTGCYLNVVGLPLCRTSDLLQQLGTCREPIRPALLCEGHDRIGASM